MRRPKGVSPPNPLRETERTPHLIGPVNGWPVDWSLIHQKHNSHKGNLRLWCLQKDIMQMLGVAFAYLLTQEKVRKAKDHHKRF